MRFHANACITLLRVAWAVSPLALIASISAASGQEAYSVLPGHVPALTAVSRKIGRVENQQTISMTLTLPLRRTQELEDLLSRLYDPADPTYGQYLTPQEFTQEFGPTQEDYEAAARFALSRGLRITGVHANRLLLDVAGDVRTVERAFGLNLTHYQAQDGRVFHAPDRDPAIPAEIASRRIGVVGLDNAYQMRDRIVHRPFGAGAARSLGVRTGSFGNGPNGGFTPADLATAYSLSSLTLKDGKTPIDGRGQTLALFELSGYVPSDVAMYEQQFFPDRVRNHTLPVLQNVLVDGFNGSPIDRGEVTLDIEMQIALAPGAKQILVYETPPDTNAETLDCYNKIATDNLAKQISSSIGFPAEADPGLDFVNAQNAIFEEMAAQGQALYVASGDNGCYGTDNNGLIEVSVTDPSSPWMVSVGGTFLTIAPFHEVHWLFSGGGISKLFGIPAFQALPGVITPASMASTTMRNMPDVSLMAEPGAAVYIFGIWDSISGTSVSAPLWAAFHALVNQKRAADNAAPFNQPLGFPCPALYTIGTSSRYHTDFHDIADGGTNGTGEAHFNGYPVVAGYDDVSGLGSFVGSNLLNDLASPNFPIALPSPIAGLQLSPVSILGGSPGMGRVLLAPPLPPGNQEVLLASDNPALILPPPMIIAPGHQEGDFTFKTKGVAQDTKVNVTATLNGFQVGASVTLLHTRLVQLTLSRPVMQGGVKVATGKILLLGVAPAGGMAIALSSSNPVAAMVPATVTVPEGANTVTFPIAVSSVRTVRFHGPVITASAGGDRVSAGLTLTP